MAKSFEMEPRKTTRFETKYRKICTDIPVPESMPIIEKLRKYEPRSMSGQPLIIWDKADNYNVYDKYGNKFVDFSSGVLVANAGHSNPEIKKAAIDMLDHGLMHNYCFPSEIRADLIEKLIEVTPSYLEKAFLLTTGSETTECAIKLMRTHGQRFYSPTKLKIVTFENDFHGRTMGAQMAGGSAGGKAWIVHQDPDIVQVPYPNAFLYDWADEKNPNYSDDNCFDTWMGFLKEACGGKLEDIAGFMPESYQGGWVQLMPKGFVQRLRKFCDETGALLTFDEVQAGFGRTGQFFTYMHYGVEADIVCCGKGISSSLPLSAVLGRSKIMDMYGPNEMTSTHTGNPVCAAAALANVKYIVDNKLVERSASLEAIIRPALEAIQKDYPVINRVNGAGAGWGVIFTKENSKEYDPDFAHDVTRAALERGVMLFAPVGPGCTIKVCPPLTIDEEALKEGLAAFREAVEVTYAEYYGK